MMNRLKSKASQFFKNSPSQDERLAITSTDHEADFSAGIERSLQKKPSRLLRKQNDKPLPNPPYTDPADVASPPLPKDRDLVECADATVNTAIETASAQTDKPRPVSQEAKVSDSQAVPDESSNRVRKAKQAGRVLKKHPSFAYLRKSSSRIFRSNTGDHDPPPPPMPQIPINTPTPKPHRTTLRPFDSLRSTHPSQCHITSISRPISSTQMPANFNPYKVPFTKPTGPPPLRPARPGSVDEDLVALARDGGARTVLHTAPRVRAPTPSTLSTSTTSSTSSSVLSRVTPDEAYTRLGLPYGYYCPSSSSPPSRILSSPLAARFPVDPRQPLPFRDSSGVVRGYGRFSAYVKARQQYGCGGYEDGVEAGDRELGPIEMYQESKCEDWTLERSISWGLGERGMLFKDGAGGWHVIADI